MRQSFLFGLLTLVLLTVATPIVHAQQAYVSNINSATVSRIDFSSNTVLTTFGIGGASVWAVATTPDGSTAYVANIFEGTVTVIDTATDSVVTTIPAGTSPVDLAVTADGARVYVCNRGSNDVTVIEVATNTVIGTVGVGDEPTALAISPDGTKIYVANASAGSVSVINTAFGFAFSAIDLGTFVGMFGPEQRRPEDVAFSPDGSKAFVANRTSDDVSVVDVATDTVTTTFPAGNGPISVAITDDSATAYVLNNQTPSISVVNLATNAVVDTLPVSDFNPQFVIVRGDCLYRTIQLGGVNPGMIGVTAIGPDCVGTDLTVGSFPSSIAFINAPENDSCENALNISDGLYQTVEGTGLLGDGVSLSITSNGEWLDFGGDFFQLGGEGTVIGGRVHSPATGPDLWFGAGDTAWLPGQLNTFVEWALGGDCSGGSCSGPIRWEGATVGTDNWMKVIRDGDGAVSWAQFEFAFNFAPAFPPVDEPILLSIPRYVTRTDGADFTLAEALVAVSGSIPGSLDGATNDGSANCGGLSDGPDVWYRYTADFDGMVDVTTCGTHDMGGVDSGIDTVLTIFDACDGIELGCNDDDLIGLCSGIDVGDVRDSALTLDMAAGQTIFIRVGTFNGVNPGAFQLNIDFVPDCNPITNIECSSTPSVVNISWDLGTFAYDFIELRRNGVVIDSFTGLGLSYVDVPPSEGTYNYEVEGFCGTVASGFASCDVAFPAQQFRRGDCSADGAPGVSLSDILFLLNFLFTGGASPSCADACDNNDDEVLGIPDVIYGLNYAFLAGAEPLDPFTACGLDPEGEALDCGAFSACP